VKKNVCRIVALFAVTSMPLLAGCRSVTWTNQMQDTPTAFYAKCAYMCGTNLTVELGMRSDGVVVWREIK
jgi:hypothetical protein